MRKLIIVVASLLVVVLLILQGFQQTYPLPEPENNRTSTATGEASVSAWEEPILTAVTMMHFTTPCSC